MKKILLSIITILTLLVMVPIVNAASKVKVYMFTKDGCPACLSASEYFAGLLKEEPKLFELIDLEIFDEEWNTVDEDAYKLLTDTLAHFGESTEPKDIATPLIVIGDYHSIGLPQNKSEVYDAILELKDSKEKIDVVKQLAEDAKIDYKKFIKVEEKAKDGKYDAIIIAAVFIVLIGGFAGLIILGKKKN